MIRHPWLLEMKPGDVKIIERVREPYVLRSNLTANARRLGWKLYITREGADTLKVKRLL